MTSSKFESTITPEKGIREALELATNVVLINRGKMAHAGVRTQEMVDDPAYLYRTYGES